MRSCKRLLLTLFLLAVSILFFCGWKALNYQYPGNWLLCQEQKQGTLYDVFYVYPTLHSGKKSPLMNLHDPATRSKALAFATAQTEFFGNDARIFAPCIRQLGFAQIKLGGDLHSWLNEIRIFNGKKFGKSLRHGAQDTINALHHYLKYWNKGRPFILFGHSQGAMDLYEALYKIPEINVQKGFTAAYLIGLPMITKEQIRKDFAKRNIHPAANANDCGVIIVWNTQSKDVRKSPFARKGTFVINPLNWKTDPTPATAAENLRSDLYRYWQKDPAKQKEVRKNLCGAVIDPEQGALIVDLPENSEFDAKGMMGKGIFHSCDIWLFSGAIVRNAKERVLNRKKH